MTMRTGLVLDAGNELAGVARADRDAWLLEQLSVR
jgi:hypothetical protein